MSRVIQGIIAGIGFLGAGVILRGATSQHGLPSRDGIVALGDHGHRRAVRPWAPISSRDWPPRWCCSC